MNLPPPPSTKKRNREFFSIKACAGMDLAFLDAGIFREFSGKNGRSGNFRFPAADLFSRSGPFFPLKFPH